MYQLLIGSLFLFSYCIAGFPIYIGPMHNTDLSSKDKIIAFLLQKKCLLKQEVNELRKSRSSSNDNEKEIRKHLDIVDAEMQNAFKLNGIFKVQYLSAMSLVKLHDEIITNYVKKHSFETNPAFTCPMKVRLDLLTDVLKDYEEPTT
jgi:SPX domain protein involved in polyphosphate accumulation